MIKNLLYLSLFALFSCGSNQLVHPNIIETNIANSINKTDLKLILYQLSSGEYGGRKTGGQGQKLAARFLADYYKKIGVKSAYDSTYYQNIPKDFFRGLSNANSENVVAYIKGSAYPNQYIIISAHYDHLGVNYGKIYEGADDNASGTSAVLEIAEAFKIATSSGYRPKRSIVFLNLTGEEEGLFGSIYYTNNPIFPLKNTISDLNIDMIGRIDKVHINQLNYVYLIGSDKLSSELKRISEKVNATYTHMYLDYKYDDKNDPNKYYYRSDHYNFAKYNIPIIFYFNGIHKDYHETTDTPDKINYDLLEKRTKLIFYTAWELANRPTKLKIDKN